MEPHLHYPLRKLIQYGVLTSIRGQHYVYLSLHIPGQSPIYALTLSRWMSNDEIQKWSASETFTVKRHPLARHLVPYDSVR